MLIFPERATPGRLVLESGQPQHGLGTGHTHSSEIHVEYVCETEILKRLQQHTKTHDIITNESNARKKAENLTPTRFAWQPEFGSD